MSNPVLAGFLNVNKPLHLTSHDVVAAVRRRCRSLSRAIKVGHAGTLDPLADGVLIICLGAATRLSQYIMRDHKLYRARIAFGATTSTYDAAGDILAQNDASHIARSDIEAALPRFLGEISQIPPMYSAIKQDGKRLYELARQGKDVPRPARTVTIYGIELLSWRNPNLELTINCGSGTYIRSLAQDLGAALEVGAYLSGLTRLASGGFTLAHSIELDAVIESEDWMNHIVAPFDALSSHDRVILTADEVGCIRQGRFIERQQSSLASPVFAFDASRQIVAVLEPREKHWKPHKVFPSQS
ncbi:MAG: tRNA pseudouridine(55) synthase TruB [Chloroflexi bacterium]|nr:tRNA pseudouridine(55) synthase TruB [Chloroflexota bacterium]